MTRINLIDPSLLCDQHLLAEHRELTRIPNTIVSGKAKVILANIPERYVLGKGHCTFFYDKLCYLHRRYEKLHRECYMRGFDVTWKFPSVADIQDDLFGEYEPSLCSKRLNIERILERASTMSKIRLNGEEITLSDYDRMMNKELL